MSKPDLRYFPPKWCRDAIADERGWKHPVTGELLISIRGIKCERGTNPYKDAVDAELEFPKQEAVPVIEVKEEIKYEETEETKPEPEVELKQNQEEKPKQRRTRKAKQDATE